MECSKRASVEFTKMRAGLRDTQLAKDGEALKLGTIGSP